MEFIEAENFDLLHVSLHSQILPALFAEHPTDCYKKKYHYYLQKKNCIVSGLRLPWINISFRQITFILQ